jgi:hypothetical protein
LLQEVFGKNRNLAVLCTESQAFYLARSNRT